MDHEGTFHEAETHVSVTSVSLRSVMFGLSKILFCSLLTCDCLEALRQCIKFTHNLHGIIALSNCY